MSIIVKVEFEIKGTNVHVAEAPFTGVWHDNLKSALRELSEAKAEPAVINAWLEEVTK